MRRQRISLTTVAVALSVPFMESAASACVPAPVVRDASAAEQRPRPAQKARTKPRGTTSAAAPDQARERWYGWKILLSDFAAVATGIGGVRLEPAFGLFGPLLFLAVAPVIHMHHDGPALASLGVRAGLPVLGGFVGYTATDGCEAGDSGLSFCRLGGVFVGTLFGMLGAMVIDATVFAYEPAPGGASSRARASSALTSGQPLFSVSRGGATLGFGAAF